MRLRKEFYKVGSKVLYHLEQATIVEIKEYPAQTDFVIRLRNGKLVQVEDWKVELVYT